MWVVPGIVRRETTLVTVTGRSSRDRSGRPCSTWRRAWWTDGVNDVAPGEIGEGVHRSPHARWGWYNNEEKTAEAFRGGCNRWLWSRGWQESSD